MRLMQSLRSILLGWYPIFYREMLVFKKKMMRLGYVFSSMFFPFLYLLAFGLGLGQKISIGNISYIEFLLPGITAMTSMTNSFNLVCNFISMGRLYFKNFQIIVLSPISYLNITLGIVLSGMVRGLIAAFMIMLTGAVIFHIFPFTFLSMAGLLMNAFLFSSLGVVAGMLTKDPEDNAVYTNFFIMPMAFFSGTFFPVDNLPVFLKSIVMLMPLSHINTVMRSGELNSMTILSIAVVLVISAITFFIAAGLIKKYEE